MTVTPSILLLLALSASNTVDEHDSDVVTVQPGKTFEYEMNETFTHDGFEISITDAYYTEVEQVMDEEIIDIFGEPENLLAIEFEFKNVGADNQTQNFSVSFYGDNFIITDYNPSMYLPEVEPGESEQFHRFYDIPEGVEYLEVDIASFNDNGTVDTVIVKIIVEE